MGFFFRWIRKLLFVGMLVCLWTGGWGLWNGLRHANPTPIVLTDAEQNMPDHVTLQNITLDAAKAILVTRLKTERSLYVPIRPQGSAPNAKVRILLKSADPKLLHATDPNSPANDERL